MKTKKSKTSLRAAKLLPYAPLLTDLNKLPWGRIPVGPRGGYVYVGIVHGTGWIVKACREAGADVGSIRFWSGTLPTPSTAMSAIVYKMCKRILKDLIY